MISSVLEAMRGVQRHLHLGATAFDDDLATLVVNGQRSDVLLGPSFYLHELFVVGREGWHLDLPLHNRNDFYDASVRVDIAVVLDQRSDDREDYKVAILALLLLGKLCQMPSSVDPVPRPDGPHASRQRA